MKIPYLQNHPAVPLRASFLIQTITTFRSVDIGHVIGFGGFCQRETVRDTMTSGRSCHSTSFSTRSSMWPRLVTRAEDRDLVVNDGLAHVEFHAIAFADEGNDYRRVPCSAVSRPAGRPEQSTETSQPWPPVSALIWATASLPEITTSSMQPVSSAKLSRSAETSVPMTRLAPIFLATRPAAMPTGPMPVMNAILPGNLHPVERFVHGAKAAGHQRPVDVAQFVGQGPHRWSLPPGSSPHGRRPVASRRPPRCSDVQEIMYPSRQSLQTPQPEM